MTDHSSPQSEPSRPSDTSVAVVTGAAGDIGAEICRTLANDSTTVVAVDRVEAPGLASQIESAGCHPLMLKADVSDPEDVRGMAQKIAAECGHIDVLVNAAAVYRSLWRGEWWDIPVDEWDRTFAVNVRGVWLCCRALVPLMTSSGGGSIVNIASTVFRKGPVDMMHYAASKAAVCALSSALARALGPCGVRVNSLLPGLVEDQASIELLGADWARASAAGRALGRNPTAREVADAVAFLATAQSKGVHGAALVVDAGGLCDF